MGAILVTVWWIRRPSHELSCVDEETFARICPPRQITKRLLFGLSHLSVAGISKYRAGEFLAAKDRWLALEREPSNPRDSNAIKVLGIFLAGRFKIKTQLGYVPADAAAHIAREAPKAPLYANIDAVFKPGEYGPNGGIRFSIWTDSDG